MGYPFRNDRWIVRKNYRFLWNTKRPLEAMINEPRIVLIEGVSPKIR